MIASSRSSSIHTQLLVELQFAVQVVQGFFVLNIFLFWVGIVREIPTPQKHEQKATKQHVDGEWSLAMVKTPPHGFNGAVKVKSLKFKQN